MIFEEILELLESEGVGASGSDLFWGFEPDSPDAAVTLYELPGTPDEETKTGTRREFPRLQITTRSDRSADGYARAMQKAVEIHELFVSTRGVYLGDAFYDRIRPLSPLFSGGVDGSGRPSVVGRYELHRRPPGTPVN